MGATEDDRALLEGAAQAMNELFGEDMRVGN
jgi:hypothetical protein